MYARYVGVTLFKKYKCKITYSVTLLYQGNLVSNPPKKIVISGAKLKSCKTQNVDPHCHVNRLEPNYKPG
jgi:hypothetical protein